MATSLTFESAPERLDGRTGAAVATANQADTKHVAAGRVRIRDRGHRAGGGGRL